MPKTRRELDSWNGLNNLLSVGEISNSNYEEVEISLIDISSSQSRKYFDEEKLNKLANNIKENGILQPIIIRTHPEHPDKYELISGERRLRASKIAGLISIPAILHECSQEEAKNIQLWENLNREQLNTYEETRAIMDILTHLLKINESEVISLLCQIANAEARNNDVDNNVIIKDIEVLNSFFDQTPITYDSYLKNRVPLLKLPEDITEYLATGKIEYTKILAINKIKDSQKRAEILDKTYTENLSLTKIKEIVAEILANKKENKEPSLIDKYDAVKKRLRKVQKKVLPKHQRAIIKSISQIENILDKIESES